MLLAWSGCTRPRKRRLQSRRVGGPAALPFRSSMVLRELQDYEQWVCWTRVAGRKLPISPATGKPASCRESATWRTYRQARATASWLCLDGIGFVFTSTDPYTGVDLDHCRTRGDLEPGAAEIVRRLNSYTEWSPSGEGLHILVKASLPESERAPNPWNRDLQLGAIFHDYGQSSRWNAKQD